MNIITENKIERRKPDYAFKSLVLQLHDNTMLLDYVKKYRNFHLLIDAIKSSPTPFYVSQIDDILDSPTYKITKNYVEQFPQEVIDECYRIINADYKRYQRVVRRVTDILTHNEQPIFITFTFRDDYLESSTELSRRRVIRDFLTSQNCAYIANIDYGKKNGREHYHCILARLLLKTDLRFYYNNYGSIDVEKIRFGANSCHKLSQYIKKLSNHAVKISTKRHALLYSRKYPY